MSNQERGRLIAFRLPPPKKIVPVGTDEYELVYPLRGILNMLDGFAQCADRLEQYAQQTASLLSHLLELGSPRVVNQEEARQIIVQAEGAGARAAAEGLRAGRRMLTEHVGGEDAWPVQVPPDS